MASENETVAAISANYRAVWQGCESVSLSEYEGKDVLELVDRFEAAHEREVEELRECLKEAVGEYCHDCDDNYENEGCANTPGSCFAQKWRKALGWTNDEAE